MIKAAQQGRDLVLSIEGVDVSLTIHPLVGKAGLALTETFVDYVQQGISNEQWLDALLTAIDGVAPDGTAVKDGPNYTLMQEHFSLAEARGLFNVAFLWQTVLGFEGVKQYIADQAQDGDDIALGKAVRALAFRLGLSAWMTSPSSVSAAGTRPAGTSTTGSRSGGSSSGKRRLRRKHHRA